MKLLVISFLLLTQTPEYCLSLYHFNLQYVPGGLKGYLNLNLPEFDLTEREVEDRIIKESFEPLLDVYLLHPAWGADIELQGYMIEVLKNRFPEVLDKLRTLVNRGQIDLVSIHYSDQLFLAYPINDMNWSVEINRRVMENNNLLLSEVVFAQEGQAGEGAFRFLRDKGYRIMVLPTGLFHFLHSDKEVSPIYVMDDDIYVIVGGEDIEGDVSVQWIYFDDGELAMTGGLNPYLGTLFVKDETAINDFVAHIKDLEYQGCKIVKISDYVQEVTTFVAPEPLPPVLDGTWHPESSLNMFKWMGGEGDLSPYVERDNDVLTLNYRASLTLQALEILAEEKGDAEVLSELEGLKKELLLAEVSDSTGWNPWETEVNYSLEKASHVLGTAMEFIDRLTSGRTTVSLKDKKIGVPGWSPSLRSAPFPITYDVDVSGFDYKVETYEYKNVPDAYQLRIIFTPNGRRKEIEISFPLFENKIEFTPALSEEMVSYQSSIFTFDKIGLPLYNGVIGLGNGYYLIKHIETLHLAGIVDFKNRLLYFIDETEDTPSEFRFTLYKGDPSEALSLAEKINTYPVLSFGEEGCGCYEGSPAGGILFPVCFIVLYIIMRKKKIAT